MRKAFQSAVRQGAVAVAAGLLAGSAFAQVIDFSSTRGSGVSQSDVLIENIRLLVPVANPFQPGTTTTVETSYNVMFRFDPATLHLVPVGLQQTGGRARSCVLQPMCLCLMHCAVPACRLPMRQ